MAFSPMEQLATSKRYSTCKLSPIIKHRDIDSPKGDHVSQRLRCNRSASAGSGTPSETPNTGCDSHGRLLKCPYWFDGSEKPCLRTHKFIRDLIRHLESHGCFFCCNCAQNFTERDQLRRHSCDTRMCVDLLCLNRAVDEQPHQWRTGCKPNFNALNTIWKWYALYALQFPTDTKPQWQNVLAAEKGVTALRANASSTLQADNNSPTGTSPGSSMNPRTPGSSTTYRPYISDTISSPSLEFGEYHNPESSRVEPKYSETSSNFIFPQVAALVRGSVQQNHMILTHDEQIGRINKRLQHIESKLIELENAIVAATRQKTRQQGSDSMVEQMEVDDMD